MMKKIIHAVPFWIITLILMYIIFGFSAQNGDESNETSQGLLDTIIMYLGNIITESVLRKLAHFCEYAALGFFMSGAIYFTFDKLKYYINIIPCALYAIGDEIHQYFVPDRACQITDMLIDSCGSSLGILVFILFICLYRKAQKKRCN